MKENEFKLIKQKTINNFYEKESYYFNYNDTDSEHILACFRQDDLEEVFNEIEKSVEITK